MTMANVLDPVPGRVGAGRRDAGRDPGRAGALADPRHRARLLGVAARAWRCSPCSSRSACRAPRRWCGCTTRSCRNRDWLPPNLGVGEPIVKPKGIDDVPIVTLTLWTHGSRARRLRPGAGRARGRGRAEARARHARGDDDRRPRPRRARAARPRAHERASASAASDIRAALQRRQRRAAVGHARARQPRRSLVETGAVPRQRAQDVRELVVGVSDGQPGLSGRRRARSSTARPAGALRLARHRARRAADEGRRAAGEYPAVTIAVTKKPGENAVDVADARRSRASTSSRNTVIPAGVEVDGHAQLRRDRERQGAAS